MPRIRLAALVLALGFAAAVSPGGASANGGPSPGIAVGSKGLLAPGGATRFVAVTGRDETILQRIRTRDGSVVRWLSLRGHFGLPLVAADGTTEGLTRDGRILVLSSYAAAPGRGVGTRFALLDARRLRELKTIELGGSFSFDALSPDGRRLYVTEYLESQNAPRYRVRVVDLERGTLLPGAITDRRLDVGVMTGQPVERAWSRDRVWAYTLYAKQAGLPFVHALDTRAGRAFCIELPWRRAAMGLWSTTMAVGAEGRVLMLTQRGKRLAEIDTRRFTVRAFAPPRS
jgi:hypothetical protein